MPSLVTSGYQGKFISQLAFRLLITLRCRFDLLRCTRPHNHTLHCILKEQTILLALIDEVLVHKACYATVHHTSPF